MFPHLDSEQLQDISKPLGNEDVNYINNRIYGHWEPENLIEIKVPLCAQAAEQDLKYLKWLLLERLPELLPIEKTNFIAAYEKIQDNHYKKIGYQARVSLFLIANTPLKVIKGRIRNLDHTQRKAYQNYVNKYYE